MNSGVDHSSMTADTKPLSSFCPWCISLMSVQAWSGGHGLVWVGGTVPAAASTWRPQLSWTLTRVCSNTYAQGKPASRHPGPLITTELDQKLLLLTWSTNVSISLDSGVLWTQPAPGAAWDHPLVALGLLVHKHPGLSSEGVLCLCSPVPHNCVSNTKGLKAQLPIHRCCGNHEVVMVSGVKFTDELIDSFWMKLLFAKMWLSFARKDEQNLTVCVSLYVCVCACVCF